MNKNYLLKTMLSFLLLEIGGCILLFKYDHPILAIIYGSIGIGLLIGFMQWKGRQLRLKYIENYTFPSIVMKKFLQENSNITVEQSDKVVLALKQFFMVYALTKDGGSKYKDGFMMPSRIADELWHNFMLDSRSYHAFCKEAFGEVFHHKPGDNDKGNKNLHTLKVFPKSLVNTYRNIQQLKQHTNIHMIAGVPILFAIDAALNIDKGFYYDQSIMQNIILSLNNTTSSNDSNTGSGSDAGGCTGLIALASLGSDSSDSGGSDSSSSDGGGCGGGCGD